MQKKWLAPAVIVLTVIVIFSWLMVYKSKPRSKIKKTIPVTVNVIRVQSGNYAPSVFLYGKIKSQQHTVLKSEVNSTVESVKVFEGQSVRAGQVLMQLDQSDIKYHLVEAKSAVKEVQAQIDFYQKKISQEKKDLALEKDVLNLKRQSFARKQSLHKSKTISMDNLQKEKTLYYSAKVKFNQLQSQLTLDAIKVKQLQFSLSKANATFLRAQETFNSTVVKAPFDGIVTELSVAKGGHVSVGQVLYKIMGTSHLQLRALIPSIYDSYVTKLISSSKKLKAVTYFNDQAFSLDLIRMASKVKSGQIGREGIFSINQYQRGMAHNLTLPIILQLKMIPGAFVVPATALYRSNTVYRVVKNRLVSTPVVIKGRFYKRTVPKGLVVISQALSSGDNIMVSAIPNAISGLLVKPRVGAADE